MELVGGTPLYRLKRDGGGAQAWIKLEGGNPGGSIKDRAAWGMLKEAQKNGQLTEKTVIVEPTSGNTGIGLAMLGRALGLPVVLTMPESMSQERRAVLAAFGAKLVLTPASEGMAGAVNEAKRMLAEDANALMLDQFSNPGNPRAHEESTGPEILAQLPDGKKLAAFVASFGTGGTVTGVGEVLKERNPHVKIFAVEPDASAVLSGGAPGPHKLQGIGAGFVPAVLNTKIIDEVIQVSAENAGNTAREAAKREGLLIGISSGAALYAALELAGRPEFSGKTIVALLPDSGERYLSTWLFSE